VFRAFDPYVLFINWVVIDVWEGVRIGEFIFMVTLLGATMKRMSLLETTSSSRGGSIARSHFFFL
jgi:hypothetical protein